MEAVRKSVACGVPKAIIEVKHTMSCLLEIYTSDVICSFCLFIFMPRPRGDSLTFYGRVPDPY